MLHASSMTHTIGVERRMGVVVAGSGWKQCPMVERPSTVVLVLLVFSGIAACGGGERPHVGDLQRDREPAGKVVPAEGPATPAPGDNRSGGDLGGSSAAGTSEGSAGGAREDTGGTRGVPMGMQGGAETDSARAPGAPPRDDRTPGDDRPPLDDEERLDDEILAGPDVSVQQDAAEFTLSNGIITARISKTSGNLRSLHYMGRQIVRGGYWSHDTRGGVGVETRVTIDPQTTGGDRAEVSVKGISGGNKLGFGPGAEEGGDLATDIEIRYSITRGLSGLYTYSAFEHLPEHGDGMMAEARFVAGLVETFDWITVDADRNRHYPAVLPDEDKYVFTAVQSKNLAYGFSSTADDIGFWFVNPTVEYLSGGPTKPEFLCHRNTDAAAAPVVLNYWRSSHYGGASVTVSAGEHWTKVIGPFLLYANEGADPQAMWDDARERARTETRKWPYGWVSGVDYPTALQRSRVFGTLELDDPLAPGEAGFSGELAVGLAHPPYEAPSALGGTREIDWQLNAKHYQFWTTQTDGSGRFSIPGVRPGRYTLYAFADGVLGEYERADITVEAGTDLDLGELHWTPVRHGRQLWDIGVANRTGAEFKNGDRYFEPDVQLAYPDLFPEDVNFRIGESDYREDWYFQHIPHGTGEVVAYRGVVGEGAATPFTVSFALPSAPRGTATLRLAIAGTEARGIGVYVNGTAVGPVVAGVADGVITRHQVQGLWYERSVEFDASLMRQGDNTLVLNVPAGSLNAGVIYDYVRLELAD